MLNLSPLRTPKMKVRAPSVGATEAAGAPRAPPLLVSHSGGEGGLDSCQLEAIADMLQEQLNNDGFVQDRQVNGQVLNQSFFGADAVGLLQDLLQNDTSTNNNHHDSDSDTTTTVTRQQALQAGRTIQDLFGLFTPTLLTDTQTDLFQFQNNLPTQVASVRKLYPSPWDRVELIAQELTSNMDCDNTTNTCTTGEPTFTAKQIIDTLMEVKLVKTRKEGVLMIRRLNEKVHCCKLASCQHPFADHNKFRDDDTLYSLVKPQHRLPQQLQAQTQTLSLSSSSSSQHKRGSKKNLKTLDIHGSSGDIQALKAKIKANNKHKQRMMRKTKSSLDITPMIKDSNYFKERVGSLKSQLDLYRRERAINNAQKTKPNDTTTTRANNNASTKNFVWSMGRGKREDNSSHKHKQNNALTAKVATPAAC